MADELDEHLHTRLDDTIKKTYAIEFDGCHKIYILMDEAALLRPISAFSEEVEKNRDMNGCAYLVGNEPGDIAVERAQSLVIAWYLESCDLRFIDTVSGGTDNEAFATIIEQGDRGVARFLNDEDEEMYW